MKKIYIQIGAGAGDQDRRSNYRDGFSEYVKSLNINQIEKIILVEPNPSNIPHLKKCWSNYPIAEVHQVAITPAGEGDGAPLHFYYAEEDGPHYQVASVKKEHVLKHYPNANLRVIDVPTIDLESFIKKTVGGNKIELLALDIEGLDAEILLSTNWSSVNCINLSFEHLHLGKKFNLVLKKLRHEGFVYAGNGLDAYGNDFMYRKSPRTMTDNLNDLALMTMDFFRRARGFIARKWKIINDYE